MRKQLLSGIIAFFLAMIVMFFVKLATGNDCYSRAYVQQYAYVQPALVYYSAGERIITDANLEKVARRVVELQQQLQSQPQPQKLPVMQRQVQAPIQSPVQAPLIPKQDFANGSLHSRASMELGAVNGSVLAAKCAECHSGANPKAGITIDGKTEMFCNQVTASIRAIRDHKMPKGGPPLSNAQKALALEELLALETRLPPESVRPIEEEPLPRPRPRDDGNLQ